MHTFGVLGHPVTHSLSPAMMTAAFRECTIDATYERFDVPPDGIADFFARVRREGIRGLSVTIPHKIAVMDYLDEIDEAARAIGAVNTMFWKDEKLCGTNTDWLGAMDTLEEVASVRGKRIGVLGAGGAARAIAYGLQQRGVGEMVIIARSYEQASALADAFDATAMTFEMFEKTSFDIVINTTPLGMMGERVDETPVPETYFAVHRPLVYDIVYRPAETRLIREARVVGCRTVGGLGMLVRQGARQFEIWTTHTAPVKTMWAAAKGTLCADSFKNSYFFE